MHVRILVAWADITGYALACWRALARRQGVSLAVLANAPGRFDPQNRLSAPSDLEWLHVLGEDEVREGDGVWSLVRSFAPSVVFVSGWASAPYRRLLREKSVGGWRTVLGMDSSLHRPVRQLLGRVRLSTLLASVDAFFVPGERGRELLSRWWRIPGDRIWSGLYGVDTEGLRQAYDSRSEAREWPRSFLFVGRYVAIKGVEELLAGYSRYRGMVEGPMPLRLCGAGPLSSLLSGVEGVEDLGYLQPGQMLEALAGAGCFVLPSRYDPWPLAIAEACAAGLPVLASAQCGSSVELIRDGYSGFLLRGSSAERIAASLVEMHMRYDDWPAMGERGHELASAFSAERWADTVLRIAGHLASVESRAEATPAPWLQE